MGNIYSKDGKPISKDGKLASAQACCCKKPGACCLSSSTEEENTDGYTKYAITGDLAIGGCVDVACDDCSKGFVTESAPNTVWRGACKETCQNPCVEDPPPICCCADGGCFPIMDTESDAQKCADAGGEVHIMGICGSPPYGSCGEQQSWDNTGACCSTKEDGTTSCYITTQCECEVGAEYAGQPTREFLGVGSTCLECCAEPKHRCGKGQGAMCCEESESCCGGDADPPANPVSCCKESESCCYASQSNSATCCPDGYSCCQPNNPEYQAHCCPPGHTCCEQNCCDPGKYCCANQCQDQPCDQPCGAACDPSCGAIEEIEPPNSVPWTRRAGSPFLGAAPFKTCWKPGKQAKTIGCQVFWWNSYSQAFHAPPNGTSQWFPSVGRWGDYCARVNYRWRLLMCDSNQLRDITDWVFPVLYEDQYNSCPPCECVTEQCYTESELTDEYGNLLPPVTYCFPIRGNPLHGGGWASLGCCLEGSYCWAANYYGGFGVDCSDCQAADPGEPPGMPTLSCSQENPLP